MGQQLITTERRFDSSVIGVEVEPTTHDHLQHCRIPRRHIGIHDDTVVGPRHRHDNGSGRQRYDSGVNTVVVTLEACDAVSPQGTGERFDCIGRLKAQRHCAHRPASRSSRIAFSSGPPAYCPRLPSLRTTR